MAFSKIATHKLIMRVVADSAKLQIADKERCVLYDVPWETYKSLLKDHENRSAPRFVYDEGTLEIYRPSQRNEELKAFFTIFVSTVAEEIDLDVRFLGSTTFRRKDLRKGIDPDDCFYVQNTEKIAKKESINLPFDPPPDLMVEIGTNKNSFSRFPIYEALEVPEIWICTRETVKVFLLNGKKYVESKESVALMNVTNENLTRFLRESLTERRSAWLKKLREWVRSVN
jgi:Uma2 family endonuclease